MDICVSEELQRQEGNWRCYGIVDWAKEGIWYEIEMKYNFIHDVPVVKTVNLPFHLPLWFIVSSWSYTTAH